MREAIEHQKISRKGAKAQRETPGHFDPFDKAQDKLREKSFLDPSHPFGMTGLGPSLCVFAPLRGNSHSFRIVLQPAQIAIDKRRGARHMIRRENILSEKCF
jgi:hypothetical protein